MHFNQQTALLSLTFAVFNLSLLVVGEYLFSFKDFLLLQYEKIKVNICKFDRMPKINVKLVHRGPGFQRKKEENKNAYLSRVLKSGKLLYFCDGCAKGNSCIALDTDDNVFGLAEPVSDDFFSITPWYHLILQRKLLSTTLKFLLQ